MRPRLHTIVASTRPGRVGPAFAEWFHALAQAHDGFEAHLVDIADFALPVFDEPRHPTLRTYDHAHTRAWSASVDAADAYVFVTPEHNYGPPASLVNALNYVYAEWNYKPAGFVSYGGVSGGLRGVQVTKQLLTTLKVVPLVEAVVVPAYVQHLDPSGRFLAEDAHVQAANKMLGELKRWAEALKPLRTA